MKTFKIFFFLSIVTMLLFSCASASMTGRKQISMKSDKSLEREAEAAYRQFLAQNTLSNDSAKIATVNQVTGRLIKAAETYYKSNGMEKDFQRFRWEINVVESPEINAFCAPGGKIAVLTGLFSIVKNEDQLAVVMAHEMSHALAKHGKEKASQGILAEIGAVALDVTLAGKGVNMDTRVLAQAGYSLGAMAAFMLPFSRAQEKEADKMGLYLMTMAGYDPEQAPEVWQNFIDKEGDEKISFFQTHPTHRRRRDELQAMIPEAIAFAEPYRKERDESEPSASEDAWASEEKKAFEKEAVAPPVADLGAAGQPLTGGAATPKTERIAKPESPVGAKNEIPATESAAPPTPETIAPTLPAPLAATTANLEKVYKIQVIVVKDIAAFKEKFRSLEGFGKLMTEQVTVEGKVYQRVLLGEFNDYQAASEALPKVAENGFSDAFLVKYQDGKRVIVGN